MESVKPKPFEIYLMLVKRTWTMTVVLTYNYSFYWKFVLAIVKCIGAYPWVKVFIFVSYYMISLWLLVTINLSSANTRHIGASLINIMKTYKDFPRKELSSKCQHVESTLNDCREGQLPRSCLECRAESCWFILTSDWNELTFHHETA